MNCTECKNLLIEYVEDLVSAPQKRNIEKHLEDCPLCKKEAEANQALRDRLIQNSLAVTRIHLEDRLMDQITRGRSIEKKAADSADLLSQIRSVVMKNTMIKIAAAAVVVLAIILGLNSFQNNITFAQVAEPVLNAHTIAYDVIFGDPAGGVAVHDIVIGRKIRRSFSNMETVLVIDTENRRMLALDPAHRGAAYVNIEGMVADNNRDFLYFVRNALSQALNSPHSAVKILGRQKSTASMQQVSNSILRKTAKS